MRKRKSERPLSTRFAEHWSQVRVLGAAVMALGLAACGSSTPRQAEVKAAPTIVAPAAQKTASAAPQAADPSRKDKRRGRDAPEPADAIAAVDAVPEAAALAYDRAVSAMRAQNWVQAEL